LEYITAIWYILWQFGNLVAIWYISHRFGILSKEKSGNPVIKAHWAESSPGLPDFSWYNIPKPEKCTKRS
jgi:hypothetical protein